MKRGKLFDLRDWAVGQKCVQKTRNKGWGRLSLGEKEAEKHQNNGGQSPEVGVVWISMLMPTNKALWISLYGNEICQVWFLILLVASLQYIDILLKVTVLVQVSSTCRKSKVVFWTTLKISKYLDVWDGVILWTVCSPCAGNISPERALPGREVCPWHILNVFSFHTCVFIEVPFRLPTENHNSEQQREVHYRQIIL